MESLADIVNRRQAEFQAAKHEAERRDKIRRGKQQRRQVASFKKMARLADQNSEEARPNHSARYGAAKHSKDARASAILTCLSTLGQKHGKHYVFPSQETILKLLNRFYGISVCRRTLNNDLQALDDQGLLNRIRRHTNGGAAGIIFKSTAYYITRAGNRARKLWQKAFVFLRKYRVQNFAQDSHCLRNEKVYAGKNLPDSPPPEELLSGGCCAPPPITC